MVYLVFGLAAIVTILAAIELSNNADVLGGKTSLGGLLVGTVLLGGATSLPEVTTSISSVLIENPDIAIGNMLGSNMFNLFIIACFDVYYRKNRLLQQANKGHLYTAGLGLILTTMTLIALVRKLDYVVLGVGIDSLLIAIVYGTGMYVISRISEGLPDNQLMTHEFDEKVIGNSKVKKPTTTIRKAIITFLLAAVAIMIAGTLLSISGDIIAEKTGLGSTFIGSFLMAATTSLPEAVAVFVALRLRNINIAIGSILGSNIFNMLILMGTDIVYRQGPILSNVAHSHEITAMTVTVLSVLVMISLMRKRVTTTFSYMMPSLLIMLGYLITSYLIFKG
ncbi:sodium:calcium antiporter [Paenisporosarcina antarctica]|uniref:Sodium:calcium antiporter n=1 Tax=Paenisporosarcina antarctica TaxID=417367 RepID=A0A4P6ZVH1_9BACL|nr:sodium:calcium antiporter [Paenisporosarcina antarctica]QBP40287.1 sodium:calcium antiporter [Paenisporosarcina antarctica]